MAKKRQPAAGIKGTAKVRTKGIPGKPADAVHAGPVVTAEELTDQTMDRIALRLYGTTDNVFKLIKAFTGKDVSGDGIFVRLARDWKLYRCDLCSHWCKDDQGRPGVNAPADPSFVCDGCLDGD